MVKKFEACVQAIHYLLKNFGEMDKLKIVKLIYFADKWQLIAAGRTITNDDYLAMRHGPAGSMALNVLNRNEEYLEPEQLEFMDRYILPVRIGESGYKFMNSDMYYDQFSESDENALRKIGEKFKSLDKWDIVNLTHKYPEWKQFERELKEDPATCRPIRLIDMFSCVDDDPLGIRSEMVEVSKSLYLGCEEEFLGDDNE